MELTTTFGQINESFGIFWITFGQHLDSFGTLLDTKLLNRWGIWLTTHRYLYFGLANVYRVDWHPIGVILTPCNPFYVKGGCQTMIDKFDSSLGPKTVLKRMVVRDRAAVRVFKALRFLLCTVPQ